MINIAKKHCNINGDIDCQNCEKFQNCSIKIKYGKAEMFAIISAYNNPLSNPFKNSEK